ncbi:hypothetical protein Trydic_g11417 [Trypoxylus dichotomus]
MLNHVRTGVALAKVNPIRWDLVQPNDDMYNCGVIQNVEHLLECTKSTAYCIIDDLWVSSPAALDVARFWAERL